MWRRAGVWVGGVVAAALATVLAGTVTQGFGWFEAVAINSQGEPVDVRVDAEAHMDDVVLSPDATLSSSELALLADLSAEEQVGWLEEHEHGAVSGTRRVTLYLTGNRAGTVRVTDVTSMETCEPISRGTLVRMFSGRGAGVESEIVNVAVGQGLPIPGCTTERQSGTTSQSARSRSSAMRRFRSSSTSFPSPGRSAGGAGVDGVGRGCRATCAVSGPDGPFVIMPIERDEVEGEYGIVYLGGEICRRYVTATPTGAWPTRGEGNFAEW